jgi:hypothetical protein
MKKSLVLFFLAISFIITPNAFAQFIESFEAEKNVQVYTFENREDLEIRFFPHRRPNIDEFSKGRTFVNKVISSLLSKGFSPTIGKLEVGISPRNMNGHSVEVEIDSYGNALGKIFVSIEASEDKLERVLLSLNYFKFDDSADGKVAYFLHNSPNTEQFLKGVGLVNKVLKKIKDAGFVMKPEKLEVGIAPQNMYKGPVAESNGKLFVSIEASEDTLERWLLKFFVWPN